MSQTVRVVYNRETSFTQKWSKQYPTSHQNVHKPTDWDTHIYKAHIMVCLLHRLPTQYLLRAKSSHYSPVCQTKVCKPRLQL